MIAIDEIILDRKARVAGRGARGMDRGAPRSMNQNHPRSAPYRSNFYRLNPSFSWHYARNRNYDPTLGRFISQDPLQYINGANAYQFVMSNPVGNVDPEGLYSSSPIPGTPYRGVWGYENDVPTHYHIVGPNGGEPLATERLDGAEHDNQSLETSAIPKKYWAPIRAWAKKKWDKQKAANRNRGDKNGPPEVKPPTSNGGARPPCPLKSNAPPNLKPFALPQIYFPGMPPPWEPQLDPQWQQQMDAPLQDPGFMQPQSAPGIPGYFQGPNNGLYEWPGGEESPLPQPPSAQFWEQMDDPGIDPMIDG
jgi:RHS repeat-associated protein